MLHFTSNRLSASSTDRNGYNILRCRVFSCEAPSLSRLYSEEKHKISDIIPLNFLLHFTDYQLHKESDHLANKLYTHKRTKLTTKSRRNYDRQAKHKSVDRYEPPKITKKTNKVTAVAKINEP